MSLFSRKRKTPPHFIDPQAKERKIHIEQTGLQLLRYLVDRLVIPEHHRIYPVLVQDVKNYKKLHITPEIVASVEYMEKNKSSDRLKTEEIPLILVTVNRRNHASLIILSGITKEYPYRQVFSMGLLMGGTKPYPLADIASVSKRVNFLKTQLKFDSVILSTPDETNDIFGQTKAKIDHEFDVKEVQVLTPKLLEDLNKIIQKNIDVQKIDYENGHEGFDVFTGQNYSQLSLQGAVDITGLNCASFISNLLPETSAGIPANPKNIYNYCRPLTHETFAKIVYGLMGDMTAKELLDIIELKGCSTLFRRGGKKGKSTKKRKFTNRKKSIKNKRY